ncbi:MAG TPA: 3-deoxy-8-phosphooctulonate synthase [archaeon]|nr:3-deoxy-8-phosphooctulonate synthase [archaeon]
MTHATLELAGRRLGGGERLFLIAGPCVVEDRDTMFKTAGEMAELARRLGLVYIFKSSFLKANRSSAGSPAGPGLEKGLQILGLVKEAFGLPVLTDIHESAQAAAAAQVADILQIPAFLCRQTELIRAAAATGRVVNIKKGQFMAPSLMRLAVEKARLAGSERIMLTERGSFFGYNDLVVDFRSIKEMAACGCPVVFDATHSVQSPGGAGDASGGKKEFVALLARAAVAAGVDGLFMEVHPHPEQALSDRHTMLSLEQAKSLLPPLVELGDYVRESKILAQAE